MRLPNEKPYLRAVAMGRNGHFKLHSTLVWAWPVDQTLPNDSVRVDAVEVQLFSNRIGKDAPCSFILGTEEAERFALQILQAVRHIKGGS